MKRNCIRLMIGLTVLLFGMTGVSGEENQTHGEVLNELGIILGSGGDLKEGDEIKRQEMMVILCRLMPEFVEFDAYQPPANPTFLDVPASHWSYKYVEFAYELGLTKGIGNGLFGIDQSINYNQASIFLLRSLGYPDSFTDYQKAAAQNLINHGFGLEEGADGNQDLIRGKVFELLSKTISRPLYDASMLKIDQLTYEPSSKTQFMASYDRAVTYGSTDYMQRLSSDDDTLQFDYITEENSQDQDEFSFFSYGTLTYEVTETARLRANMLIKVLDDYGTFSEISLDEFTRGVGTSMELDLLTRRSEWYEGLGYQHQSFSLSIYNGSATLFNSLIGTGYERRVDLLGYRKYEFGDGTQAFLVRFMDDYSDGNIEASQEAYIAVFVDANGEITDLVGESLRGIGYKGQVVSDVEDSAPEVNEVVYPAGFDSYSLTKKIQWLLSQLGFSIDVDGYYGVDTASALIVYEAYVYEEYREEVDGEMSQANADSLIRRLEAGLSSADIQGYMDGWKPKEPSIGKDYGNNGLLSTTDMVLIPRSSSPSTMTERVERETAIGWAMAVRSNEFVETFDHFLNSNFYLTNMRYTGYRSYSQQEELKAKYGTYAATPGESNHGWGLAVDMGAMNTYVSNYLVSNEGRKQAFWVKMADFGFYPLLRTWSSSKGSIGDYFEGWHWDYIGPYMELTTTTYSGHNAAVQRDVKRFIVMMQSKLNYLGYSISVDGSFGPMTKTVVMEFQEDHGLKADGVCDMATWEVIDLAVLER